MEISRDVYHALLRVTGLLDRVMQPYFGQFGISRSQWACLRVLRHAEREGLPGVRPMDLGRRLWIRPPSITGLIERLRRLDYVTSSSSASDGRGKMVRLTERGHMLVERVSVGHAAQIAAVMDGLDAKGQQQLNLLLQRLTAHLEAVVERRNGGEGYEPGNEDAEPSD